jgi:hypothetical protein
LVVRTDFSDDAAWKQVCARIEEPVDDFRAYVSFLDDHRFANLATEILLALVSEDSDHSFFFVVDSLTVSSPEHPILAVDCLDQPGRTFRVVPREMWSVENNLSLSNMGFEEFAESVDEDGVFRGFSD